MSARPNLCRRQLHGEWPVSPKVKVGVEHNTTHRVTHNTPQANAIDDRLETRSANTPAPSAPNRHPSSSTAADGPVISKISSIFSLARGIETGEGGERRRTHESALPRPDGPSRDKVVHDEHVRDDALIVSEREAADRGERGAAQRVRVGAQAREPRGSVRVCVRVVAFATAVDVWVRVGAHGQCAASDVAFESVSMRAGGGPGGPGGGGGYGGGRRGWRGTKKGG